MTPWSSSSLTCFSLLTAFLFGTVATFGSNVGQLCAKWKSDPAVAILAMGIITEAGGESRFYAVSSEFEGITVPADALQVPPQGEGTIPQINLNDAESLDLSSSKASWPQEGANGKGAFILAFQPKVGFHSGEQFLAFISASSSELLLASLTNPETVVKRVPLAGDFALPSGPVFSTDNKLTSIGDASIVASMRFIREDEGAMAECYLRRDEGQDSLRFQPVFTQLPNQVKASLAIDGGFLLNGHTEASRLFALSNGQRKIYVFYGNEETAVEVSFDDFLVCPNEWLQKGLKATGIAVPVIVIIGAVFFFMSAKKMKNSGALSAAVSGKLNTVSVNLRRSAPSGTCTVASTATGKSTFKTATAARSLAKVKTRTRGKPRTAKKKKSTTTPGMLARSMESSPGTKAAVFKFKAAK